MIINLRDGSQVNVPDTAFRLAAVGETPTFVAEFTTAMMNQSASDNAKAKQAKLADYNQWVITNIRNRQLGTLITEKPKDTPAQVFHTVLDAAGNLFFWQTNDGPGVAGPCPDLPAGDPAQPTTPLIGKRIGDQNSPYYLYGRVFASGTPDGKQIDHTQPGVQVHGTSLDGVTGVFLKVPSYLGAGYWDLMQQDS